MIAKQKQTNYKESWTCCNEIRWNQNRGAQKTGRHTMLHKGRNNGSHKHSTSNNITTTIDKSTFLSWAVVRSVTGIRYSYASSGVKKRPFGDKPSRRWFVSNASTCVVVLYVWPESVPITYDSSSSMRFWVSWHKYDAIIFKQFQLSTFNNNNNTIECTYCRRTKTTIGIKK